MKIGGLQKCSLLDYPQKLCANIFTQGCNFKCHYCHNPSLLSVAKDSSIDESFVLEFLKSRIDRLDAVVITGGEPCLQKDLAIFIKKIKKMNYLIKLDTNGSKPDVIQDLIKMNLLDYIAMDIKAPVSNYKTIVNTEVQDNNILKSIEIIKNSNIEHEFRTTVVKSLLSPEDIMQIGELVKSSDKFYLQKFIPTNTLNKNFKNETTYSNKEFEQLKKILRSKGINCIIR